MIAVGWMLISSMNNTNESTETSGNNQNQPAGSETSQDAALTITYNGTEFMPSTATVKVGDAIEVVNDSQNVMQFASDQHPTHLDNSEFNVGDIEAGGSATFTVTAAGTWGYHDHYNATADGEVIVE
jgi:plastocyanin